MLQILGDISTIPTSTLIVILMAAGVNLLFAVGRRFLTNVEWSKRAQAELREFNKELRQSLKAKDKSKEDKMMKKKKQMDAMQAKLMMENTRVTFLFFLPMIGLWWLMSGIIGANAVVAMSPIPFDLIFIKIDPHLNFFWWYFICSLALSGVITKATGTSLTD
ncbi:MAG: DUF106 domain-containing protein [Thaumarchaeota archaeon]|nr:DUF106 domain-containing protein [Nitrososphaerota archaeon]